jgi:hypothetical protein
MVASIARGSMMAKLRVTIYFYLSLEPSIGRTDAVAA